ncbi:MAG: hypothetical protein ACR2FO_00155 [Actinomycetota bacterium]
MAIGQPNSETPSARERALAEARRKGAQPYDPERDRAGYQTDFFQSDQELQEFIDEIYAYRRQHPA